MGIKTATASAIAAGIGSIELPSTGIGSDWIWWTAFPMRNGGSFSGTNNGGMGIDARAEIDSKAMRKVGDNSGLIFVVQNVVVVSTHSVQVTGGVRVLLKT